MKKRDSVTVFLAAIIIVVCAAMLSVNIFTKVHLNHMITAGTFESPFSYEYDMGSGQYESKVLTGGRVLSGTDNSHKVVRYRMGSGVGGEYIYVITSGEYVFYTEPINVFSFENRTVYVAYESNPAVVFDTEQFSCREMRQIVNGRTVLEVQTEKSDGTQHYVQML